MFSFIFFSFFPFLFFFFNKKNLSLLIFSEKACPLVKLMCCIYTVNVYQCVCMHISIIDG